VGQVGRGWAAKAEWAWAKVGRAIGKTGEMETKTGWAENDFGLPRENEKLFQFQAADFEFESKV
jgi:hypothetical protein